MPMGHFKDAYARKRLDDCTSHAGPMHDKVFELSIDFPAWMRKMLGLPSLAFTERVWHTDTGARITATAQDAAVKIEMVATESGTDTHVSCHVELSPRIGDVSIPSMFHPVIRTFVRRRFKQERQRDQMYGRMIPAAAP